MFEGRNVLRMMVLCVALCSVPKAMASEPKGIFSMTATPFSAGNAAFCVKELEPPVGRFAAGQTVAEGTRFAGFAGPADTELDLNAMRQQIRVLSRVLGLPACGYRASLG